MNSFTVYIYTISDEDIHVPAIVVEEFALTKSNKHEKNWMQHHPFFWCTSISCPSLLFRKCYAACIYSCNKYG